ncbi:hypothetical protein [Planococcus rifietoensis]|uniref:hypothetical protein n=1 Tax=Planococcus rifietoensis TaxID=200991 RepID=UPI00384BD548
MKKKNILFLITVVLFLALFIGVSGFAYPFSPIGYTKSVTVQHGFTDKYDSKFEEIESMLNNTNSNDIFLDQIAVTLETVDLNWLRSNEMQKVNLTQLQEMELEAHDQYQGLLELSREYENIDANSSQSLNTLTDGFKTAEDELQKIIYHELSSRSNIEEKMSHLPSIYYIILVNIERLIEEYDQN